MHVRVDHTYMVHSTHTQAKLALQNITKAEALFQAHVRSQSTTDLLSLSQPQPGLDRRKKFQPTPLARSQSMRGLSGSGSLRGPTTPNKPPRPMKVGRAGAGHTRAASQRQAPGLARARSRLFCDSQDRRCCVLASLAISPWSPLSLSLSNLSL